MVMPMTQWFGSGFGHSGSTSKIGALTVPVGEDGDDWAPSVASIETTSPVVSACFGVISLLPAPRRHPADCNAARVTAAAGA